VAVVKEISPVVLTRIVEPKVPSKLEPDPIEAEAPSIVRAPPEVVIVPAVVTLLPASISMFLAEEISPAPVETVEAALEIITSWPALRVVVVLLMEPLVSSSMFPVVV
jgi:hypothetical protein